MVKLNINGKIAEVLEGTTILAAARSVGEYIPVLCSHPDLPPVVRGKGGVSAIFQGERKIINAGPERSPARCGLCLVSISGKGNPALSCSTPVREGMTVTTESPEIEAKRRGMLKKIMASHPHACLNCDQKEGCSRTLCSMGVAEDQRCCDRMGRCELQKIAGYIRIPDDTPGWRHPNLPVATEASLIRMDYNLCIGCTRCVRGCRDRMGVGALGYVIDERGKTRVGTVAPTLRESGCTFCTLCTGVCPTGALSLIEEKAEQLFSTDKGAFRLTPNPDPPEGLTVFTRENILSLPDTGGVYRLFDRRKKVISIKGCPDLRKGLLESLGQAGDASLFDYELSSMFTLRESELIQRHLTQYGEMPGGDLDDLF